MSGRAPWLVTTAALAWAAACIPGSGPALITQPDAEAPPPVSLGDDGGVVGADVDLGDPFAIVGLNPSHGPFSGGTRAVLVGRGFPSTLRVWVGGVELDPSAIFASQPTRAAVEIPPGKAGPADVMIRDDATAETRTLAAGFFYDAFALTPDTGATSGGTRVALVGSGTAWKAGASVQIGAAACTDVAVADATHLQCTTPAGAPGSKDVTVTNADATFLQARDAYTYSDSPDGYRGGLTGGALNGSMRVLAFDAWTGTAIAGAHAIAGSSLATAVAATTDASGLAELSGPSLAGQVSVTIAAKCHQPTSFVAVPVDTVTAYLTPTLDPSCAQGDPPSTGGSGGPSAGEIDGTLVFPGKEAEPGTWTVPAPAKPSERQAAYVFLATGSPSDPFVLPAKESATTPDMFVSYGYSYTAAASPGTVTLYALAGLEDRTTTPPRFVAYAMGVARGVSVQPATRVTGVDIPMSTLLDHAVTLAPAPPSVGPRGPDRLSARLAVTLGETAFAVLPDGLQTALLPFNGTLPFVGVPALDGTLSGERYAVGAQAVTGPNGGAPASIVTGIQTTDSNAPVAIGGFLPVPVLSQPGAGTWGGTHVSIAAGGAVDLIEAQVSSGGGLVAWTIVAPGGTTSFDLPDLSALPDNVGLVHGPVTTTVYVARIEGFTYGTLRYGQLGTGAWSAYAFDSQNGAY